MGWHVLKHAVRDTGKRHEHQAREGKKGTSVRLTSLWAEDLPGTTYGLGPLSRSIVCRGRTQIVDGANRALAAIEYVTGTIPRGDFDTLRRNEISKSCPTACSSTYASSRFIFWYSGISQTPGQSFSSKKDELKTRGQKPCLPSGVPRTSKILRS